MRVTTDVAASLQEHWPLLRNLHSGEVGALFTCHAYSAAQGCTDDMCLTDHLPRMEKLIKRAGEQQSNHAACLTTGPSPAPEPPTGVRHAGAARQPETHAASNAMEHPVGSL